MKTIHTSKHTCIGLYNRANESERDTGFCTLCCLINHSCSERTWIVLEPISTSCVNMIFRKKKEKKKRKSSVQRFRFLINSIRHHECIQSRKPNPMNKDSIRWSHECCLLPTLQVGSLNVLSCVCRLKSDWTTNRMHIATSKTSTGNRLSIIQVLFKSQAVFLMHKNFVFPSPSKMKKKIVVFFSFSPNKC